jgi:DNA-binding response OmpR family regulator
MKESIEWRDIPVIMCSALSDSGHVMDAARLGCQHYVLKPYSKDVMLKKVTDALETRQPMLMSEPQLRQQFGLDANGLKSLLREFQAFYQEQIDGLDQRIKSPDDKGPAIDFNKLSENTDLLGVDKLKRVISELKIKADYTHLEKQDYLLLQGELKHVNRCLKELTAG